MDARAETLLHDYYAAFERGDMDAFLALLTDDVVHDLNQGGRQTGVDAFARFMERMNERYRESVSDLEIMTNASGTRAAAEFTVTGTYLATDEGLPEANGQRYELRAGAFFEIRDGRISRVTNYYDLRDWIGQVSGRP